MQPLPEQISFTVDLLTALHVEKRYHRLLLPITDGDSLIDCKGVDARTLEMMMEYFYPRSLTEVMQQHNLVLHDIKDLQRFKEGDLLSFLLELSPEQEKFASWSLRTTGPTLVKGGPGTGKSTVALYRIRSLLDQLLRAGQRKPAILFTTYTNALIKASEQQLQQLLGDNAKYVKVDTADSIAHSILTSLGQIQSPALIGSYQETNRGIQQAIAASTFAGNLLERRLKKQTIERMGLDYLAQEFNSVIIGRQIATLDEYQKTSRNGRKMRLNATQRSAVWQIYQCWCQLLQEIKKETWQQRRVRAEVLTQQSRFYQSFDAVIIDEAQDLDPSALRMLIQTCKAPNRLFITADANQSIYGASFSWSDIHQDLRFQGRTSILRANYRSTAEIGEAAHSYLSHAGLELAKSEQQYINHSPLPNARAISSSKHEIQLLANYFRQTSRDLHLTLGSCAILCPSENVGKALASDLCQRGLEATFMTGKELNLARSGIKVLTLKSSKGLEFPIVALAGFVSSNYPAIPAGASQEEIDELLAREQRTLFVGMTRAMRALLVIIPHKASTLLLQGFDETYWNLKRNI
jgi:superfamily I DNA/RNA helicase